jgi:hypothetical protein
MADLPDGEKLRAPDNVYLHPYGPVEKLARQVTWSPCLVQRAQAARFLAALFKKGVSVTADPGVADILEDAAGCWDCPEDSYLLTGALRTFMQSGQPSSWLCSEFPELTPSDWAFLQAELHALAGDREIAELLHKRNWVNVCSGAAASQAGTPHVWTPTAQLAGSWKSLLQCLRAHNHEQKPEH